MICALKMVLYIYFSTEIRIKEIYAYLDLEYKYLSGSILSLLLTFVET